MRDGCSVMVIRDGQVIVSEVYPNEYMAEKRKSQLAHEYNIDPSDHVPTERDDATYDTRIVITPSFR